ncbi:response regulator [Nannocystis pusilla]|uniref:response regulator n=1 Tax=Nannocystis pusilla TaxID=889268 RepID=UPI003BF2D741
MTAVDAAGGAADACALPRVLVVDDERDMLEILQDFFESEGYTVQVADSGERAIELCRHGSFDVAITDMRMPGIDGLHTLMGLRQLDPRLPVIVVTGYASDDTEQRCRNAGAFDCIQKPVDLDTLLRLVGAAVQARN